MVTVPTIPAAANGIAGQLRGVRALCGVEIGTVMFGRQPDGSEQAAAMDLVRLAIPRRVYTQSHIDYVAEMVATVKEIAWGLRGYKIVYEPPVLRHFTARFEPLAAVEVSATGVAQAF